MLMQHHVLTATVLSHTLRDHVRLSYVSVTSCLRASPRQLVREMCLSCHSCVTVMTRICRISLQINSVKPPYYGGISAVMIVASLVWHWCNLFVKYINQSINQYDK